MKIFAFIPSTAGYIISTALRAWIIHKITLQFNKNLPFIKSFLLAFHPCKKTKKKYKKMPEGNPYSQFFTLRNIFKHNQLLADN